MNITNISAGGHHSWLIVDNMMPEKEDYESPSPLGSGNFSPTFQKSVDGSPKTLKANASFNINNLSRSNLNQTSQKQISNNLKFNLDMLHEKISRNNNKNILQVAYTDLKMSHRFIRFYISNNSPYKDVSYKDLNAMMNEYLMQDDCVVLYRLQDDSEVNFANLPPSLDAIFKDMKSNFKLLDVNTGKKSFSLTIVYDVNKNDRMSQLKVNIDTAKNQNNILTKNLKKSLCKQINKYN